MPIYDISRKDDKDGDWWFSITGKYSEVTILPQEGAAVAYNIPFYHGQIDLLLYLCFN